MDKADSIRETRQDKQEAIKVIKRRIESNKLVVERIKDEFYKANAPKGYSSGSSLEDYDMIPGTKKEYGMMDLAVQLAPFEIQIKLDEGVLSRLESEPETEEYLKLLTTDREKVIFLREIKKMKQWEIGEKLLMSERKVRKILNGR